MAASDSERIAELEAIIRRQTATIDALLAARSTHSAAASPINDAASEYMARIKAYGEQSLQILLKGGDPPAFQHKPPATWAQLHEAFSD